MTNYLINCSRYCAVHCRHRACSAACTAAVCFSTVRGGA